MVLDRKALQGNGAMALTHRNGSFEAVSARPEGLDRPWARRREVARSATAPGAATPLAPAAPRDATPLQPDIDAEE